MRKVGFTLLELLVSIAIIGILVTIGFVANQKVQRKAKKVKCISHIKSLHGALSAAILDQGHWPQIPIDDGSNWTEAKYYQWWVKELDQYGVAMEVWLCPSDIQGKKRFARRSEDDTVEFFGSYGISKFERGSKEPFKTNQPWIIERGSYHQGGGHLILPDGSISTKSGPIGGR